jgi:hypothetical protein
MSRQTLHASFTKLAIRSWVFGDRLKDALGPAEAANISLAGPSAYSASDA